MKYFFLQLDDISTQGLQSGLKEQGHDTKTFISKQDLLSHLDTADVDCLVISAAHISLMKPVIIDIRRVASSYMYIFITGGSFSDEDALTCGANARMDSDLDAEAIGETIRQARAMKDMVSRLGDDSRDFPSAGGVIAKSAFNQLFLGALERGDRYAEKTYIIRFSISNYRDIFDYDGSYAAEYSSAKLSRHLVLERRQSDVIGQTGPQEFCLLLLRPLSENEPKDAAARFAQTLKDSADEMKSASIAPQVEIQLIDLPSGRLEASYEITPGESRM